MPQQPRHPAVAEALAASRGSLAAVALFSFFANLLTLAVPLYMLQIYDRVLPARNGDTLLVLTVGLALALAASAGLDAVRGVVLQRVGQWFERRVAGEVMVACVRRALTRQRPPSTQALRDVGTVRSFVGGTSLLPLLDAPWTFIYVVAIFTLHPALGLITLGGALLLLGLTVANELATRPLFRQASDAQSDALDQAQAAIRNADAVEAMGMRANLLRLWGRQNELALRLQAVAGARGQVISSASHFVREVMQAGVLATAAWLVIDDVLTGGAMFAAMFLMRRVAAPLDRAVSSWRSVIGARNAYDRLAERLAEVPPEPPRMALPAPATGRLEVTGLTYRYEGTAEPILREVSLRLEPGEILGLVGPTAAGKSTLGRLLVGLLRPEAGKVRLDGVEIGQWDPEALGPHLGYLPQDTALFAGTVGQNIARLAEPDPGAVVAAARLADVHEMVLRLPKGYDTEVGDGGLKLSGGQRQRIGLARAVYGLPKLVVLDEPDANLDREGQAALEKALLALKAAGSTAVVITHRGGMLKHADKVLMVKRAAVVPAEPEGEGTDRRPAEPERRRPAEPGLVLVASEPGERRA